MARRNSAGDPGARQDATGSGVDTWDVSAQPSTGRRLTPLLLAALGVLAGIGPLSTDLLLPGYAGMAAELGTDPASVQVTLTWFLVGIGVGPLTAGPLADRFGRRPVLLASLVAYALAGAVMAFAGAVWVLDVGRLVQGAGAAAGVVLSRSIAADLERGARAVRAVSLIAVIVGVAALVAPVLGGALVVAWGWRGTFGALATLGVFLLLLVLVFVPETHPPEARANDAGPLALVRGVFVLLGRGEVRGYVVVIGAGYAAMTALLVASPFIGTSVLGLEPLAFGVMMATAASAMPLASLANAVVALRVGAPRMLLIGQALILAASLALFGMSLAGVLAVWSFTAVAFVLIVGNALSMANTTALTLAVAGPYRGAASALCSTGQYSIGATAPVLVAALGAGAVTPMAIAVGCFAALGVVALLLARRSVHRADPI